MSIFYWLLIFLEACYLFFRQMSTTSYVPGTAVNAEKTAVNKTDKILALVGLIHWSGGDRR